MQGLRGARSESRWMRGARSECGVPEVRGAREEGEWVRVRGVRGGRGEGG